MIFPSFLMLLRSSCRSTRVAYALLTLVILSTSGPWTASFSASQLSRSNFACSSSSEAFEALSASQYIACSLSWVCLVSDWNTLICMASSVQFSDLVVTSLFYFRKWINCLMVSSLILSILSSPSNSVGLLSSSCNVSMSVFFANSSVFATLSLCSLLELAILL